MLWETKLLLGSVRHRGPQKVAACGCVRGLFLIGQHGGYTSHAMLLLSPPYSMCFVHDGQQFGHRSQDFSHLVPQMYLQDLAEADAPKELIQAVQVGTRSWILRSEPI